MPKNNVKQNYMDDDPKSLCKEVTHVYSQEELAAYLEERNVGDLEKAVETISNQYNDQPVYLLARSYDDEGNVHHKSTGCVFYHSNGKQTE